MWLVVLVLVVSAIYLLSMQGITDCNSGSLYALVRSIVKKGKLSINSFVKYTKYMDCAKRKKDYYTDRPPGTAFAAIPFYLLNLNVTLVSVISGILSTILVYLITMHLINNSFISFSVGLIFALCTINWRYSTTFLIHPLSTFLTLLAVYGLFLNFPPILIGVIFGISTLVEYTNIVLFCGVGLTQMISGNFLVLFPLGIGYALGIIPLLIYNKKCFGSPLTTSYKYGIYFKWSNSPKTTFVNPLIKGIGGLLFYLKKKNGFMIPGGILSLSPVLLFGIIGYFFLPSNILILFLCLTLPLFLLIAKHKTYFAGGGGDYRYLSSIIPYLVIPIGFFLVKLSFLWPLVLLFAILSLVMMTVKMLALTITEDDLKEIDDSFVREIKENKKNILNFLKLKYLLKMIRLVIKGLFIKKIHLENEIYKKTRKNSQKNKEQKLLI
ncbi:Uncharacterised protein [uncultured archaeon]|nr:Uncharacterised protein [uncultured archaeon]